jgi:hypothetical protein
MSERRLDPQDALLKRLEPVLDVTRGTRLHGLDESQPGFDQVFNAF